MTSHIQTMVFDLDNTLYSPDSGLLSTVSGRISEYIMRRLNLCESDANQMREDYRNRFGITLTGLVNLHNIDPIDFDEFVYDIDYTQRLTTDLPLYDMINTFSYDKIIYTNAGRRHANIVLEKLGLDSIFDKVIAIEDLDFLAKPTPDSFQKFIDVTSVNPETSIFFEDSIDNLNTAKQFGFTTVLVGNTESTADFHLSNIYEFPHLFSI